MFGKIQPKRQRTPVFVRIVYGVEREGPEIEWLIKKVTSIL